MDIVKKLNNWMMFATGGQKILISEARDEIERLREALKKYQEKSNG
jgi:hypothetical protein